ncbi:hypothetical protein [Halococcus qingdaonensis]|uniref:hypothetical protein n=1 Tax=Halococcus qingdaonensis TaxID=224402 RepID=UPI0021171136|nr:hypothetical protein [Halococcus qingdaonensis]
MALLHVVGGAFFALLGGWYALSEGIAINTIGNVVAAAFWFVLAGYTYIRPESMDHGTEPTPRRWFELAALVGGTLAAILVAAFAIEVWL